MSTAADRQRRYRERKKDCKIEVDQGGGADKMIELNLSRP